MVHEITAFILILLSTATSAASKMDLLTIINNARVSPCTPPMQPLNRSETLQAEAQRQCNRASRRNAVTFRNTRNTSYNRASGSVVNFILHDAKCENPKWRWAGVAYQYNKKTGLSYYCAIYSETNPDREEKPLDKKWKSEENELQSKGDPSKTLRDRGAEILRRARAASK